MARSARAYLSAPAMDNILKAMQIRGVATLGATEYGPNDN